MPLLRPFCARSVSFGGICPRPLSENSSMAYNKAPASLQYSLAPALQVHWAATTSPVLFCLTFVLYILFLVISIKQCWNFGAFSRLKVQPSLGYSATLSSRSLPVPSTCFFPVEWIPPSGSVTFMCSPLEISSLILKINYWQKKLKITQHWCQNTVQMSCLPFKTVFQVVARECQKHSPLGTSTNVSTHLFLTVQVSVPLKMPQERRLRLKLLVKVCSLTY